jgi:hypothetical protein
MSFTPETAVDQHSVGRDFNTRDDGQGKTYRSCQKHESVSLHDLLSTGRHLLDFSFITSLKSNLCTTLTTLNTAEK